MRTEQGLWRCWRRYLAIAEPIAKEVVEGRLRMIAEDRDRRRIDVEGLAEKEVKLIGRRERLL